MLVRHELPAKLITRIYGLESRAGSIVKLFGYSKHARVIELDRYVNQLRCPVTGRRCPCQHHCTVV